MSKKTLLLVAIAGILVGYYLSAKIAGSFVGKFLTPMV